MYNHRSRSLKKMEKLEHPVKRVSDEQLNMSKWRNSGREFAHYCRCMVGGEEREGGKHQRRTSHCRSRTPSETPNTSVSLAQLINNMSDRCFCSVHPTPPSPLPFDSWPPAPPAGTGSSSSLSSGSQFAVAFRDSLPASRGLACCSTFAAHPFSSSQFGTTLLLGFKKIIKWSSVITHLL